MNLSLKLNKRHVGLFFLTIALLAIITTFVVFFISKVSSAANMVKVYTSNHSAVINYEFAEPTQTRTGGSASCVLATNQLVYCSGLNTSGQLGDGTTTNRSLPVEFKLPVGKTATAMDSTGSAISCALTSDQLIYCAGSNNNGQLGNGTTISSSTPVLFQLPAGKFAASLQTGLFHTCVITTDQLVYCAGKNLSGQLGDASTTDRSTPVLFQLPAGKFGAKVVASYNHTCVLTTDQLVYCAGLNGNGQLGDTTLTNRSTPVLYQLPAGKTAATLSIFSNSSCVVTTDQLMYCAGRNTDGALGDGTIGINRPTPVLFQLPAGKFAVNVHVVTSVICAVTTDQLAYCAGANYSGQLGDGTTTGRTTPVQFQVPGGKTVSTTSSSSNTTCIETTDQFAYCVGGNTYGQLGNGTTVDQVNAVQFMLP